MKLATAALIGIFSAAVNTAAAETLSNGRVERLLCAPLK